MHNRLSEEALKAELDSEVLALLVEEGPESVPERIVQETLADSLVNIQATRSQLSLERLSQVFVTAANEIIQKAPEYERRLSYAKTGLSTVSCELIRDHVDLNHAEVRNLLLSREIGQLDTAIGLFLRICLKLSEMQSDREFSGSFENLLQRWMQGTEVGEMTREFAAEATSSEELGRFIDDLFRYRLPWGYFRIHTNS